MSELMRYYGQFGNANGIRNDRPVASNVVTMLSEVELVELKKYVKGWMATCRSGYRILQGKKLGDCIIEHRWAKVFLGRN